MRHVSLNRCMVVVFAAAVALLTFSPARNADAAGIAANAKMLAKLDNAWSSAAATRDTDRVVAFYAEDAIVYPPNEPVAVGRKAARKVWAAYFAMPKFSISWKTTTAEISKSGEIGFTAGTYKDSYDDMGGERVHETGKYLCWWRKQKDGTWKAIHDMWNTDSK